MSTEEHGVRGLMDKIEEKHREHIEEREAARDLEEEEPNKKQRDIDQRKKDTLAFENEAAFADADVFSEET